MKASRYRVAGAAFAALLVTLVLAAAAGANPPSTIVIPAGYVATLSNATFGSTLTGACGADRLNYGYELNAGPNVQVGPTGVGCEPAPGATIGPFSAPTQLRIYIDDFSCSPTSAAPPPNVFYSDGLHALVTPVNALTWGVALMDSDLCTIGPASSRVPPVPVAGNFNTGNFNVTITLTPASPGGICTATRTLVIGSSAYRSGSFLSRGYAGLLTVGACGAIDQASASPSPQNAGPVAQYDGYVTRLVHGGWLSATDGANLAAEAAALL